MKIKSLILILITSIICCGCNSTIEETIEEPVAETIETAISTADELVCDGYFAPTVVTDSFLEAYNFTSGSWVTEDGSGMLQIYEEDGLYYFAMDALNSVGGRFCIGPYNMYNIAFQNDGADERTVFFECNDGLMQMQDTFIVATNHEYIRYEGYSEEFTFYPFDGEEISAEAYVYVDLNIENLRESLPVLAAYPDSFLMTIEEEFNPDLPMDVPEEYLRETAQAYASLGFAREFGFSEFHFTDTTMYAEVPHDSQYDNVTLIFTFDISNFRLMTIETDSGELLYENLY